MNGAAFGTGLSNKEILFPQETFQRNGCQECHTQVLCVVTSRDYYVLSGSLAFLNIIVL